MTNKPATPDYILKAVRKYDRKAKKVQAVFNLEKPLEAKLYEAIKDDAEPFSTLIKRLLAEHYNVTDTDG